MTAFTVQILVISDWVGQVGVSVEVGVTVTDWVRQVGVNVQVRVSVSVAPETLQRMMSAPNWPPAALTGFYRDDKVMFNTFYRVFCPDCYINEVSAQHVDSREWKRYSKYKREVKCTHIICMKTIFLNVRASLALSNVHLNI